MRFCQQVEVCLQRRDAVLREARPGQVGHGAAGQARLAHPTSTTSQAMLKRAFQGVGNSAAL